jgi:hypothetical protein
MPAVHLLDNSRPRGVGVDINAIGIKTNREESGVELRWSAECSITFDRHSYIVAAKLKCQH